MSDDPLSDEILELVAKPTLTDEEHLRLRLLLEPEPQRWGWRRSYRWLRDRLWAQNRDDTV